MTKLDKSTRTLFVTLNCPEKNNSIHQEMLFEFESLLAWCTSRVEIHSIFIDSSTSYFSPGLDKTKISQMSAAHIEKLTLKLHKIIFSLMQMPQTVVIDLKNGASNWAMELALGADIRICSVNADLRFDHARFGLSPASGGASFLTHLISPSFARTWLSTGASISPEQREASGLIYCAYDSTNRNDVINDVLKNISLQAPVQRIQTKLAVFEAQRQQIETALATDLKIAKASRISEDWKTVAPKKANDDVFMPAKSMSYSVKLSLVKSDEATPRPEFDH
jgi:enoyl-CoA hydratase/carnithine racemase